MVSVLPILFALVVLIDAQVARNAYKCSFTMTKDKYYPTETVTGTLRFDWVRHKHDLSFTSGTQEVYSYNPSGGYNSITSQFLFLKTNTCACTQDAYPFAQPPLVFNLNFLTAQGNNVYKPSKGNTGLTSVTFAPATGFPTASVFADGRTFTYSNCVEQTFTDATWAPPAGCNCGQPTDVVIVLDRSSSITKQLFDLEKQFVVGLTNAFTYGPLAVNLGITNFHTRTWDGPVSLKDGTTRAAVTGKVPNIACYPSSNCIAYPNAGSVGSCCGSGTCVSCGIVVGADMLASQASKDPARSKAGKILIVFTDGFHAVITPKAANGVDPKYDATGKITGDASKTWTAAQINTDLAWAVAYAKKKVPGIVMYAVAAGNMYDNAQLLTIAGGDINRVFATPDWNKLNTFIQSIVVSSCTGANPPQANSCCNPNSCSPWCKRTVTAGGPICQDGNIAANDGCSSTCLVEKGWKCNPVCNPICGDGLKLGKEACDDKNTKSGDGCSSTCTVEPGWTCPTVGQPCLPICGDGLKVGKEGCDDKNNKSGDGCSHPGCAVETGWTCPVVAQPCQTICGDGLKLGKEACDDKNNKSGDGCSFPGCAVEAGWTCPVAGQRCQDIDECKSFGCVPDGFKGTICADSLSAGPATVGYNQRRCTCNIFGLVLSGTDQSRGVTSVTLTGNQPFPGCVDVNECTLYGCPGGTCAESAGLPNTSIGLGMRVCSCSGEGYYVNGLQTYSRTITLVGNAPFAGCAPRCGDGILISTSEQCDDGNFVSGDGCSADCLIEEGYDCPGPNQKCCVSLPMDIQDAFPQPMKCWDGFWVPDTQ